MTLTPKQQRFVEEYLVDLNATGAARRAGYSARTAEQIGAQNLRKRQVAAAITEAQQARAARTKIDADWVLRRLAEEARADLADIFDDQGRLRPISDWPDVFRRGLVTGIESFEEYAGQGADRVAVGRVRKVKLSDRIRHVELIGRHVGVQAFRERLEHGGPGGGPIPLAAVQMTREDFARLAAEIAAKV